MAESCEKAHGTMGYTVSVASTVLWRIQMKVGIDYRYLGCQTDDGR